jgi:hypothetical protein
MWTCFYACTQHIYMELEMNFAICVIYKVLAALTGIGPCMTTTVFIYVRSQEK